MRYSVYFFLILMITTNTVSGEEKISHIARFYNNKQAAVSLRFDDSHKSHITIAVPLLNRYGIRATFMIIPGRKEYQRLRSAWETNLPAMGHRLGNHTWNHKGAKNLEQAEYEIGEPTRLIRGLYPGESELLVFASGGGGKKWGGKYWEEVDPAYRQLVAAYHLIDLYDGHHPTYTVYSYMKPETLHGVVDKAIAAGEHQVFNFHNIETFIFKDFIKGLINNTNTTTPKKVLETLLIYLDQRRPQLWLAPMEDVYKYREEYTQAALRVIETKQGRPVLLQLEIGTDPVLYDQELTLVIPAADGRGKRIQQDEVELTPVAEDGMLLVNVKPYTSQIKIQW